MIRVSDQFPQPGQPGQQPPTQVAPQGGGAPPPPQYGAPGNLPQQGPAGYPQPQPGYPGAPGGPGGPGGYGGGYPGGPGGFPPPPGGGGSKKGLIIGIIVGVVALVLALTLVLVLVLGGDDDKDDKRASDDDSSQSDSPSADESSDFSSPTEDSSPSSLTSPTDGVSSYSTETPAGDPKVTAREFLDALLEGKCTEVESLSTPTYFASEFTDQAGCQKVAGNLSMSNAEYTFDEPVTFGSFSTVTGDVYAPNTGKTLDSTWILDGSSGSWKVSGYTYVEK